MAVANSGYTVLLIGKTGMGKSTTANKLIDAVTEGNPTGNGNIQMRWPRHEEGELKFKTAQLDDVDSVTKGCTLLSSKGENGGMRVLDTEGFAGSDFPEDVHRGNLQIAREIAGVSSELALAFNKVLYFLPIRGKPEKADKVLQDEINLLWHFFGEDIFKHLVLTCTLQGGIPSEYAPKAEDVQRVFSTAMKLALEKSEVSKEKLPQCPPVLFIPIDIDSPTLVEQVKMVQTLVPAAKAFKPEFRREVCAKCAAALYFSDTTLKGVRVEREFHGPDQIMCHPIFVPKYSKVKKFFGGIAHVAVLGFAKVHELRTKKATWPGFFNTEEVCDNCKKAPGAVGCMKVEQKYNHNIVVEHNHKMQGIIVDQ